MELEEISWISRIFRKIDMFSSLSMTEATDLIENMEKVHYVKGEKIIKQGDKGDSFFIVYKGKVKVSVKKGFFSTVNLGELGPEQFFGEMALLSDEPRSATVAAAEDTDCFVLFKGQFQHLLEKNPSFQNLVQRAREKRSFEIRRNQ